MNGKMNPVAIVLIIGVIAGTFDIVAAIIVYSADPTRLFQLIAGGAIGLAKSLTGGMKTAMLGVFFHYFIATTWTLIYFVAYRRARLMRFNKWVAGVGYGVVVWCGMNLVVLPLSRLPGAPMTFKSVATSMTILIFAIGIPISYMVTRYYAGKKNFVAS